MTAEVIDLEEHRSVWCVMRIVCAACGRRIVGVVHVRADPSTLECAGCGEMRGRGTPLYARGD